VARPDESYFNARAPSAAKGAYSVAFNARTIVRHLERLLASGRMLHIIQPEEGHYRATCDTVTGANGSLAGALAQAVELALDKPPPDVVDPLKLRKKCVRCKVVKDLEAFPNDASRPDKKFHSCFACERVRWRAKDAVRRKRKKGRPGYNNRAGP
jgi:hypothetical protein